MSFAAPSVARDYRLISSLDPALDGPVRRDGETDKDWEARDEAWQNRLRVARETGEWGPLLKDGATPAVFTCRQVPGELWAMLPRVLSGMKTEEQMGHVLRVALVGIENFVERFELKLANHIDPRDGRATGLGKVAAVDVVTLLSAIRAEDGEPIGPLIISELGSVIVQRQNGAPSGK